MPGRGPVTAATLVASPPVERLPTAKHVAACVGLAAWPGLLSGMGKELVVLSAVAVLFFVAGQWIGLKRLQAA